MRAFIRIVVVVVVVVAAVAVACGYVFARPEICRGVIHMLIQICCCNVTRLSATDLGRASVDVQMAWNPFDTYCLAISSSVVRVVFRLIARRGVLA